MKEDDYTGCGISAIWATGEADPFYGACARHDAYYSSLRNNNTIKTRKEIDRELLHDCLALSTTLMQKAKAYLFYALARCLGGIVIS